MKKLAKRLAVLITVLCVALTCAFFAACGDNPPAEKDGTYTVTVVLPDGSNAGAGIKVVFCNADTGICLKPIPTDENGIVVFNGEKGVNYHIQVNDGGFPEGYYAPNYTMNDKDADHYTDNWEGSTYTITLTKNAE